MVPKHALKITEFRQLNLLDKTKAFEMAVAASDRERVLYNEDGEWAEANDTGGGLVDPSFFDRAVMYIWERQK